MVGTNSVTTYVCVQRAPTRAEAPLPLPPPLAVPRKILNARVMHLVQTHAVLYCKTIHGTRIW